MIKRFNEWIQVCSWISVKYPAKIPRGRPLNDRMDPRRDFSTFKKIILLILVWIQSSLSLSLSLSLSFSLSLSLSLSDIAISYKRWWRTRMSARYHFESNRDQSFLCPISTNKRGWNGWNRGQDIRAGSKSDCKTLIKTVTSSFYGLRSSTNHSRQTWS